MRQVPRYGIIGNGRAARHFSHYLHLLQVEFCSWKRGDEATSENVLSDCDVLLVLIKDSEIEKFILTRENRWLSDQKKILVHFSGALTTDLAHGFHPLMTFAGDFYDLKTYQNIPFIIEKDGPSFKDIFPRLSNPSYPIEKKDKALYHALCVMGGNFPVILINELISSLQSKFDFPAGITKPYLGQIFQNLMISPEKALTGPFAREDAETMRMNYRALIKDFPKLANIYAAFMETYEKR